MSNRIARILPFLGIVSFALFGPGSQPPALAQGVPASSASLAASSRATSSAPPARAPAVPAPAHSTAASASAPLPPASAPRPLAASSASAPPPAVTAPPTPPEPAGAADVVAEGALHDAGQDAANAAQEATPDATPAEDAPTSPTAAASAAPVPPASSAVPAPPAAPVAPAPEATPPAPQPTQVFWPTLPFAPESGSSGDDLWQLAERIFPVLPAGQREGWVGYLTLAALTLLVSTLAGRARHRLPVRGLIPRAVGALQLSLRALVIVLVLTAIARLLPRSFWPALPWVVLAAAAAVGWSARDFLPDAFAAVLMVVERRILPGRWITGTGFEGEVETLGLRATRLRDAEGRTVSVPNRTLLATPLTTESTRRPVMEIAIRAPGGLDPLVVRRAIEDAALLSPWRALDHQPDVRRDGADATLWRVRVRLLEARFLKSFQSALVDHVEEILTPSKALSDAGPG